MGTLSTITFVQKRSDEETPLVTIYQQYSGYIDGVGHDLAKWLLRKKMINGIGFDQWTNEYANGLGCLVAQYIRDHKDCVGSLYIVSNDIEKKYIDYHYTVVIDDSLSMCSKDGDPLDNRTTIYVTNWDNKNPIFVGKPSKLLKFKEE